MQFIITKTYRHSKCNNKLNFMLPPASSSIQCISPYALVMLSLLLFLMPLQSVDAGSCREAQLCCSGRDSSCVVQKAPINAIIEDLSDKPCYCDHACLKLGDCCDDFKDHCGVLDCQVSDWGQWSECDKSCGTGMMSRTRKVLQAAQNGGKHCPSLVQKRGCQGFRCHGHRDKKILREMALLLPAALSRNRHANDSSDIRRNLRLRYRDSYKHNREHEYCVEFEVIKASKACHKLPPYNQMLEGDRIIVRCDLEALIQDANTSSSSVSTQHHGKYKPATIIKSAFKNNRKTEITNNSAISDDDAAVGSDFAAAENHSEHDNAANTNESTADGDDDDDGDADETDEENMLDTSSNNDENYEYDPAASMKATRNKIATTKTTTTTTTTTTTPASPITTTALSYHCRGEGLPGRTTRWSALAAPSCRGKWLRLTVGAPKKCTHSQFIFV